MVDAAVESLLDDLRELTAHHSKLISKHVKSEMKHLADNIYFLKSFLKKASTKKRRKDEVLHMLVQDIRDVVYDVEDVISIIVTTAAENKTYNYFAGAFHSSKSLLRVAQAVETICRRIVEIYGEDHVNLAKAGDEDEQIWQVTFDSGHVCSHRYIDVREAINIIYGYTPFVSQNYLWKIGNQYISHLDSFSAEQPTPSRKNFVGLKDEAEKLKEYLKEVTSHLDVISIIGMPGLGKTTLTEKIFEDPDIKYEFPTRIWICVSQEYIVKEVFLAILKQIMTKLNENEYEKKSAAQLAEEISSSLEGGKFLLVLDDVWDPNDWENLKPALPMHNTAGKIMITSRHMEVGRYANRFRDPHILRFLNQEESVELLQWEVFNKPEFPAELNNVGRLIAYQCDGIPLSIVVIGGVLTTEISASDTAWEKVSMNMSTFFRLDTGNSMHRIIAMSYDKLPHHLKECFLYFGMFPEDFEIPAWKLIQMWIAEGLIHPKDGFSKEDVAEYYLDDLINRNLVEAKKLKADGRVKTCRIHDILHDFCKIEGGEDKENFLHEIRQSSHGVLEPLFTEGEKHRRLCIHSNILDFLKTSPKGIYVRSFVTFSEDVDIPAENISVIYEAFKLLKVLEATPLKFSKIPRDFYHLVHLKYLALSLKFDYNLEAAILPQAFSKLWNIETLIVHTTFRKLEVKADIIKMTRLRHLKTDACATLVKPAEDSREGERLQTLSTVSPESCTEAIFDRARNLKKLSIRGKIAQFLDGKIGSFECLGKLGSLENLKLLNDLFPKPAYDGKLDGLPPAYKFPAQLRSLTLFSTFLDWSHMSVLGSLEKLQALKLKDNAFVGMRWEVSDTCFDSLEVLHIGRTNLSTWVASAYHFPRLGRLQLHNCDKLEEIPFDLANIPTLKHMDLLCCQQAAASATKIAEIKNDRMFHLSIFPPSSYPTKLVFRLCAYIRCLYRDLICCLCGGSSSRTSY